MKIINPCDCDLVIATENKRKKDNHELLLKANTPLTELFGTEHDHWHRIEAADGSVSLEHRADAVWLAAVEEYKRRIAAYRALKPF